MVDEAVLALTGYRLPDALDVFYARRGADVSDHRLRRTSCSPGRRSSRRPARTSFGRAA